MENRFRIDQSGEVDHYIWGNLRPVLGPWNTLDSFCNQPLPKHGLSLPCNALSTKNKVEETIPTTIPRCRMRYLLLSNNLHCTPLSFSDLLLLSCRFSNLCSKFPLSAKKKTPILNLFIEKLRNRDKFYQLTMSISNVYDQTQISFFLYFILFFRFTWYNNRIQDSFSLPINPTREKFLSLSCTQNVPTEIVKPIKNFAFAFSFLRLKQEIRGNEASGGKESFPFTRFQFEHLNPILILERERLLITGSHWRIKAALS